MIRPRDVLDFWFAAGPEKWFKKSDDFDAEIRRRFGETHAQAAAGKLDGWAADAQGSLALILVLDQFSRNLWRNDHRAFAQDAKALALADDAVRRRFDVETPLTARKWFYMPYMHAEDLAAQERGIVYFAQRLEDPETMKFAVEHRDIIRRFGRFPHRNAVLGRETTPEEQSFLDEGGFAG
ncbi:DUF924 family protein [Parvibaculum sp.]|jgi:uncharacterized protein (DUF924 family)|uniref:DUF924 family protein n=1 Tax=Parvibaculum sp. TaxID=2024848 RepID=UPI000C62A32E|nr:DUF924 family protein [Parvibaculum sp.]MAM93147.1 hypothetical protein [Parvibaculum sp.]HCX69384.1 DUF924 domain-containing protein [Rhodobiaceae bacterium]|tara:strand:- start:256 stop:798 length:543 start_codon:yes stop_codon:yes gene_type:complete